MTILDRFAEDSPKVNLHGEVHVVSRVVGFKKIRFQTNENVGSGELDLPDFDFFAWDARGHGRSPGPRGYSPSLATSIPNRPRSMPGRSR